jgi:hypothetical protein
MDAHFGAGKGPEKASICKKVTAKTQHDVECRAERRWN